MADTNEPQSLGEFLAGIRDNPQPPVSYPIPAEYEYELTRYRLPWAVRYAAVPLLFMALGVVAGNVLGLAAGLALAVIATAVSLLVRRLIERAREDL